MNRHLFSNLIHPHTIRNPHPSLPVAGSPAVKAVHTPLMAFSVGPVIRSACEQGWKKSTERKKAMLIKATLSNARHPEYGEVTIPFPIKTSEYDHTMEMLANLEIGNVMGRDCKIMELSSPYSILQKLEGSEVNIDELDYLAKRLESFEADQDLQFQAAAFARGVASIEDFINLTFCSDQATVIYDFTKLEEAGRQHFMNLHGGCASTEELENLDGYETALLLIDGGGAEITPYGVLYDNGMQMEQLYKGGPFPPYLYDAYELVLPVSPTQSPQNKTYLYLPSSNLQLERTLLRGRIMEREGWFHKLEPIQLSSVITAKLDTRRDSIRELNEMCRSIHLLSHVDRSKLDAAVEYAQAKTASQIRKVAEHLDQFDFAPGVHTPEEYGRYMIRDSGHFNYDSNLDEFYDYGKYGRQHLEQSQGMFTEQGYISYQGVLSLEALMKEAPTEQFQEEQGEDLEMGGLT